MDLMEFQSFGWNAETVSFIGSVFFVVLTSQPTFMKGRNIWSQQTGQSVSVIFMAWLLLLYFTGAIYGWSLSEVDRGKSSALIFSGVVRVPLQLYILVGLWQWARETTQLEWATVFTLAAIGFCALLIPPNPQGMVYLCFALGAALPATAQLGKLWKAGSVGPIPLSYLLSYALSTTFWLWYAFEFDVLVLKIGTIPMFVVVWLTVAAWVVIAKRTDVSIRSGFWPQ